MFENVRTIYFLGIGGIGMSALAKYFVLLGKQVHGYDRQVSILTKELEAAGVYVHYEDSPDLIPPETDLVVYTPAIPISLKELQKVEDLGIVKLKRSEVLGIIAKNATTLAIAGTHGKTSVSTICAHILHGSSSGCSAFLGGIAKNYDSNFLAGSESSPLVVEADEYDRSFHRLYPDNAVITSMDADHLDIYGTHEALRQAFRIFAGQIKNGGTLIIKDGLQTWFNDVSGITKYTYSLFDEADFCVRNLRASEQSYLYDLKTPEGIIENLCMNQVGLMYLENGVAASALALSYGITVDELRAGLMSFAGVKRRFDVRINKSNFVYIDDYAHHPGEIDYCISSVKSLYPGKRICGVFQPHLFSRTRDFADDFARSLEKLDTVVLLDIYPAREIPISGVSSSWLLQKISIADKLLVSKENLIEELAKLKPEILLTMGAGDIDLFVETIENTFLNESENE